MAHTLEQVFVTVDGRQVALAAARLISVSIEQSLVLPDAFNIVLTSGLGWLHDDTFAMGKEVKLEMSQNGRSRRTLITGEVTGLLPVMTAGNEVQLQVRGYDRSHRLQRGRYTRSFVQVTDSDIARRVASDLGLGTDIDTTSEVHAYILQRNQTNLEFLQERAALIGYQVGVNGRDLYFKRLGAPTARDNGSGPPVELAWGEDLEDFEVSQTTPGQATKVTVRGWDYVSKQKVTGQATSSDAGPETRRRETGGDTVRSAFSVDAPMDIVRPDISSQAAAERLAQVICDELHSVFTTAEGVAGGNPGITPGATVKLSGIGAFDGKYLVSQARHVFDRNGYKTVFSVSGARSPAVAPSIETPGRGIPSGLFVVGIVTNNEDPDEMGRIKVKFPTLSDDLESDWCRVVSPMSGADRGIFFLPEVNDEVLVAFEGGGLSRPVVIGSLWNGMDAPPLAVSDAVQDGKVVQRVIQTRAGHMILFDDNDGAEKVVIEDMNGNQIVFECSNDKLTIKAAGDIEIQAGNNLTLRAGGNVDIQGARINLN